MGANGSVVDRPAQHRRHSTPAKSTAVKDGGLGSAKRSKSTGGVRDDSRTLRKAFFRDYPSGVITLEQFKRDWKSACPAACSSPHFIEHLFRSFDMNRDGQLDFTEYAVALAILQQGNRREKENWVFRLFDVNGDGTISRAELLEVIEASKPQRHRSASVPGQLKGPPQIIVTKTNGKCQSSCSTRDKVVAVFDTIDQDGDGLISKREFMCALQEDPLLLKEMVGNTPLFS